MRKALIFLSLGLVVSIVGYVSWQRGVPPPEVIQFSTAEAEASQPWSAEADNLALAASAVTASASDGMEVGPWAARDGSVVTEWACTPGFGQTLMFDLGGMSEVEGFTVYHPSIYGASPDDNLLAFDIDTKINGEDDWEVAFSVLNDSTEAQTTLVYEEPQEIRYAALMVGAPSRGEATTARVVEFEVWGQRLEPIPPKPTPRPEEEAARRRVEDGNDYVEQHEWDAAMQEFEAVLNDPEAGRENHAMALLGKGIVLFDLSVVDDALGIWQQVIDEYPDCAEPVGLPSCRLGQYHLVYHRWTEAYSNLALAMGRYPNSEAALWARVHFTDYFTWRGDPRRARQVVNEVLSEYPGRAPPKMAGWAMTKEVLIRDEFIAVDKTQEEIDALDDIWHQFAGVDADVAVWTKHTVAVYYYRNSRFEQCVEHLQELLAVYPSKPQWSRGCRYMLADALYRLERMDEARAQCDLLIAEDPTSRAAGAAKALIRILDNHKRQWAWRLRDRRK